MPAIRAAVSDKSKVTLKLLRAKAEIEDDLLKKAQIARGYQCMKNEDIHIISRQSYACVERTVKRGHNYEVRAIVPLSDFNLSIGEIDHSFIPLEFNVYFDGVLVSRIHTLSEDNACTSARQVLVNAFTMFDLLRRISNGVILDLPEGFAQDMVHEANVLCSKIADDDCDFKRENKENK